MELTYDPQHNIAYIRLHPKRKQVETIRISDELNVDMAPDGTVYGIELLNANQQLADQGRSMLVLVSKAGKHRQEIPLSLE